MPTKKIADLPSRDTCLDRDHVPPSHMIFKTGIYEHTCPSCGTMTTFTIRKPIL